MPDAHSKQSRALANVRLQLRTKKTRGKNPRVLTADELHALELKSVRLQEEMAEARHERAVASVNSHTTREAAQTREAVAAQLEPLTRLVVGEGGTVDERIKARRNQISLMHAANREDILLRRQQLEAAREARSRSASQRRRPRMQPQSCLVQPDVEATSACHPPARVESQPGDDSRVGENLRAEEEKEDDSSTEEEEEDDSSTEGGDSPDEEEDVVDSCRDVAAETVDGAAKAVDAPAAVQTLQAVVVAVGGEPMHVLLRSTDKKSLALRADAVSSCREVKFFKGTVDSLAESHNPLATVLWQSLGEYLWLKRPPEEVATALTHLYKMVGDLAETGEAFEVELNGSICRSDRVYELQYTGEPLELIGYKRCETTDIATVP